MVTMLRHMHTSINGAIVFLRMRAFVTCDCKFTPMRGYDNGGRFAVMMRGYINTSSTVNAYVWLC